MVACPPSAVCSPHRSRPHSAHNPPARIARSVDTSYQYQNIYVKPESGPNRKIYAIHPDPLCCSVFLASRILRGIRPIFRLDTTFAIYQDGFHSIAVGFFCFKHEGDNMPWEKPTFREINMSSEIGAYQEDFEEREPGGLTPAGMPNEQVAGFPQQADTRI